MKTNTTLELLADYAEQNIAASMAQVAGSIAPTVDRVAGEIDMAYKLKLIDYPRRDVLLCQLRVIVNNRRQQLREIHNARLLEAS